MNAISVLVVDDQVLVRSAVVGLIGHEPDLAVLGAAGDGEAALALARELRPDIILMDIRMPVLDGIAATQQLTHDPGLQRSKVIILTTFEEDDYLFDALRAGASGFIGKGAQPSEIIAAVRTVFAGDALLSPRATRTLVDRYVKHAPPARPSPSLASLTEREREVLTLVGRGLSNDEIAGELVISPLTSKTHVNRVMAKLVAHDRAQLVIAAYENGLVTPGLG